MKKGLDKIIAEVRGMQDDLHDAELSKLEVAQLHIKELREALTAANNELELWRQNNPSLADSEEAALMIDNALSKQPDTRALDKALLEARIEELNDVRLDFDIQEKLTSYKAKLAELNKE